jgi:transposase-like protein
MINTTLPPMRPELVVCPNSTCGASGRCGVHAIKARRYTCHACGTTCAETTGTPLFGLKPPLWLVLIILALLAQGWPVPAIVFAFGLAERTVADWQLHAGQHAKAVHQQVVCQGQVDVGQVQADELDTKTQAGPVWIATAMTVFSRLWRWGAISWDRAPALVAPVLAQVRAAAPPGQPILLAVDGFKADVGCILKVWRDRQPTGKRGRPPLVVWADRHSVPVVKHRVGRRLVRITRQLAHGSREQAAAIMQATQVTAGCINTA